MKFVVETASYTAALNNIERLLSSSDTSAKSKNGADLDVVLGVAGGKASLASSNAEGWIQVPLQLTSCEGEGRTFTRLSHLKAVKTKAPEMVLSYESGDEFIGVEAGRTRGNIHTLHENDIDITAPDEKIEIKAIVPEKLLRSATAATVFKPMLDTSSANTIVKVSSNEFSISAYDVYIGTHYSTTGADIRTKGDFQLVLEMSYWKKLVAQLKGDDSSVVKLGSNAHSFRVKTGQFDLYRAVIDESVHDVKDAIEEAKESGGIAIDFDGKLVTEAIASTMGVINKEDKDNIKLLITINKDAALLKTTGYAGNMTAEFDVSGYEGDEELSFTVSPGTFSDTLKLTKDGSKYGVVRLYILDDYVVMESLNIPSLSIAPTLEV